MASMSSPNLNQINETSGRMAPVITVGDRIAVMSTFDLSLILY